MHVSLNSLVSFIISLCCKSNFSKMASNLSLVSLTSVLIYIYLK